MALDTRDQLASVMQLDEWTLFEPMVPPTTFTAGDLRHIAHDFSGFAAGVTGPSLFVGALPRKATLTRLGPAKVRFKRS